MKKNAQLHIKINSEEKQKLEDKAAELGLDLSGYVRMVLMNSLKGEIKILQ